MTRVDPSSPRGALREVPFMGVIYVVHEAMQEPDRVGPALDNMNQGLDRLEQLVKGGPPPLRRTSER